MESPLTDSWRVCGRLEDEPDTPHLEPDPDGPYIPHLISDWDAVDEFSEEIRHGIPNQF
jgi:hypothetical protein